MFHWSVDNTLIKGLLVLTYDQSGTLYPQPCLTVQHSDKKHLIMRTTYQAGTKPPSFCKDRSRCIGREKGDLSHECLSVCRGLFLSGGRQDRINQKLMVFQCLLSWSLSTSLPPSHCNHGRGRFKWMDSVSSKPNWKHTVIRSNLIFFLNFPEEKK